MMHIVLVIGPRSSSESMHNFLHSVRCEPYIYIHTYIYLSIYYIVYIRKLQQKIGGGAKNRWVEMAEGPYCAESNALSTQVEDCKVSQVLEFDCRLPSGDEDSLDIHRTSNTNSNTM